MSTTQYNNMFIDESEFDAAFAIEPVKECTLGNDGVIMIGLLAKRNCNFYFKVQVNPNNLNNNVISKVTFRGIVIWNKINVDKDVLVKYLEKLINSGFTD